MTRTQAAPGDDTTIPQHDGNDVDVHYLEHTHAALGPIMAASNAAAVQGTDHHVRALARLAYAEQTDQLATISACLLAWGRPTAVEPHAPLAEAATRVQGPTRDHVFADQLTAHAHASLASARLELVAGVSHTARPIAEAAIHKQDRRLAALHLLFPPTLAKVQAVPGPGSVQRSQD